MKKLSIWLVGRWRRYVHGRKNRNLAYPSVLKRPSCLCATQKDASGSQFAQDARGRSRTLKDATLAPCVALWTSLSSGSRVRLVAMSIIKWTRAFVPSTIHKTPRGVFPQICYLTKPWPADSRERRECAIYIAIMAKTGIPIYTNDFVRFTLFETAHEKVWRLVFLHCGLAGNLKQSWPTWLRTHYWLLPWKHGPTPTLGFSQNWTTRKPPKRTLRTAFGSGDKSFRGYKDLFWPSKKKKLLSGEGWIESQFLNRIRDLPPRLIVLKCLCLVIAKWFGKPREGMKGTFKRGEGGVCLLVSEHLLDDVPVINNAKCNESKPYGWELGLQLA